MPIHWTIDSRERLVSAVAEGGVTRDEYAHYLDVMTGTHSHGWRKLFDGLRAYPRMSAADVHALGARVRDIHAVTPPGPLAIAISQAHFEQYSYVIGILAAANRPMRVFTELASAEAWLHSSANRAWLPKG